MSSPATSGRQRVPLEGQDHRVPARAIALDHDFAGVESVRNERGRPSGRAHDGDLQAVLREVLDRENLDKAVLEALACGRPALTCNQAFVDFFGPDRERYLFRPGDDAALAERLATELVADPVGRRARGLALRKQVVAEHSVEHLADELVALLG